MPPGVDPNGPGKTPGTAATTLDTLSRPLRDLRISVTDRCNLRCPYCMPREAFGRDFAFTPASQLLSFEEIARVVAIFAGLGVRKVRLTGGEPLLRRDLPRLVEMLAAVPDIEEIALTTNGTLLAGKAAALAQAGLARVTVSLDALDQRTFAAMSDSRAPVARVLAGIDAACTAGLRPLKVNMVVRRGVNDDRVLEMAERFREAEQTLRFIEYMDVGQTNRWRLGEVVPAAEVRRTIEARWPLEPLPPVHAGEVASRYRYRDGAGEVGFIASVSEPFCGACTRARISADGKLYTCLFARQEHDLRTLLRNGASDQDLTEHVQGVWTERHDRYSAERSLAGADLASPMDGADDRADHAGGSGRRTRNGEHRHTAEPPKVEMSYIGG